MLSILFLMTILLRRFICILSLVFTIPLAGFVVVGVIFACLLVSAGSRGAPGVLILPLEQAFGWDRAAVSLGAAAPTTRAWPCTSARPAA